MLDREGHLLTCEYRRTGTGDCYCPAPAKNVEQSQPPMADVDPKPEVGSLYIDYHGNAIRLVFYATGKPIYRAIDPDGETFSLSSKVLPEGARLIWSPTGGPR